MKKISVILSFLAVLFIVNFSFAYDEMIQSVRTGHLIGLEEMTIGEAFENCLVLEDQSWESSYKNGEVYFMARIIFKPRHFDMYQNAVGQLSQSQIDELYRVGESYLFLTFEFLSNDTFLLSFDKSSQIILHSNEKNECDSISVIKNDIIDIYYNPDLMVIRFIDAIVKEYPCLNIIPDTKI